MPIYEYRCDACGHELERIQRMSDAPLTECPDCGKNELRRLVSAAGFRLKGGGWYETDFKKDGKRNLHDSHTGSATSSGDKAASSKPAESKKSDGGKSSTKPSAA